MKSNNPVNKHIPKQGCLGNEGLNAARETRGQANKSDNNMKDKKTKNHSCSALLDAEGFHWRTEQEDLVHRYLGLIREWNDYASLVASGDVGFLFERHVVDSLSLGGVIRGICGEQGHLLDIGSGGGFPAIPLKVLMPDLQVTMVERTSKKVGFLRQVIGELGFKGVDLVHGEFPQAVKGVQAAAVTARAVEGPKKVLKGVKGFIEAGAVFLWQGGEGVEHSLGMFHVELVEDAWGRAGLRRGTLFLVRRKETDAQG